MVLSGKKLSDITFQHIELAFNASEFTLPNTPETNNGEFGPSDKLIKAKLNGNAEYPELDWEIDRTTANAHKIIFLDENGEPVAHAGDLMLDWQLG